MSQSDVPEEQHFIVSSLSPGLAQKRLAGAIAVVLLLAFCITAGLLSSIQLPRADAFVPAYATAIFVVDLITAILLFAQFSILRSRALLVISSGYLFTALIVIPWTLTFPGVLVARGLLGGGLQSTAWLYIMWHGGFAMFVVGYALLKDRNPAKWLWLDSAGAEVASSVALTAGLVFAATLLVTVGDPVLPRLMLDTVRLSVLWFFAVGAVALLSAIALVALWIRGRSVLDLWLRVVMLAYIIEVCLISFPVPARFSVGWYAGRVFGLISASLVLFVLLYETTTLYARLLRAVFAQRREREARLMTGDAVAATIAHEIRQPLSAMITNADAGLRWLGRPIPDLEEVKADLERISADGHRAAGVIGSIRAVFKKEPSKRVRLDVNQIIAEALGLVRDDLAKHRIWVRADLRERLPQVIGDRTQLQQVMLNLITNAIDSMTANDGPRLLEVKSGVDTDGGIMASVGDTGAGISAQNVERVFDPLFTTKPDGMGMGLSICRAIIESHDGRLWASPNTPRGAVFRFVLRADKTSSTGNASQSSTGTTPLSARSARAPSGSVRTPHE